MKRILFNKYSIGINNKRNKCVSCSLVLSSAIWLAHTSWLLQQKMLLKPEKSN